MPSTMSSMQAFALFVDDLAGDEAGDQPEHDPADDRHALSFSAQLSGEVARGARAQVRVEQVVGHANRLAAPGRAIRRQPATQPPSRQALPDGRGIRAPRPSRRTSGSHARAFGGERRQPWSPRALPARRLRSCAWSARRLHGKLARVGRPQPPSRSALSGGHRVRELCRAKLGAPPLLGHARHVVASHTCMEVQPCSVEEAEEGAPPRVRRALGCRPRRRTSRAAWWSSARSCRRCPCRRCPVPDAPPPALPPRPAIAPGCPARTGVAVRFPAAVLGVHGDEGGQTQCQGQSRGDK